MRIPTPAGALAIATTRPPGRGGVFAARPPAAGPAALAPATRRVAAPKSYLDRGEDVVRAALSARGLLPAALPGHELRGLAALVGRGLVNGPELEALAMSLRSEPAAVAGVLAAKRPALMALIGREHGLRVEDGQSRWSVQELANLDYVLGELPESFKRIVRDGPPFRRDGRKAGVAGEFNPFTNRARLLDGANVPADASLEQVKAQEARLRGTMLQELGHAWQIRSAAPTNPGVWGLLVGVLGVAWRKPDFISEWARISGWTVRPKWSLASLFGQRATPNLGNASMAMTDLSFTLLGRRIRLGDLTGLRYDATKKESFVSDYARTDPYEDFADSVIAYFADPAVLKRRSPEKYAFMRDRVMGGKEFDNAYGVFT